MATKEQMEKVKDIVVKLRYLECMDNIIYYDRWNNCPKDGFDYEGKVGAYLTELSNEKLTSKETKELVESLEGETAFDSDTDKGMVRYLIGKYKEAVQIPASLQGELNQANADGQLAWGKCYEADDFESFKPVLKKQFDLQEKIATAINPDEKPYQVLVNRFDKDYRLEEIVALCEKSGVHTKFIPDYNNIIPTKPYTEDILGLPVINIRYVPLSNTFNALIKRSMDIAGAIVAIIVSSPVMLVLCMLIKLTSPGPLIYKQERVGLHNQTFRMYKFRSMEIQKESEEKKAWTVKNDPRVTGIGKFMRHTSLDELPQLFNILKGEMSLVGPRPERPFFVEKFREEIPRYMVKHQVRPGLTGWAQVNGYRGDTSIRKRIECDLYYIENWSVGFDIKIMFLTIFKGFINKNAY